jgi:tRNA(Ile)-lysidine synthase TilS/MesJ
MKRCKRCIFPDTVPGITFNEEGICSFCLDYEAINCLGENELVKHIDYAKTQHQKYDCIVPLSGGRDSTYVLYAANKYNLKILAVNYDNEFRTEQALINMEKACNILNVDFMQFKSKRNIARKIVSTSIEHSLKYGLGVLAGSFCDACSYGYRAVVYMMASKYNAPLILWGRSQIEETETLTHSYFRHRKTLPQKILDQFNVYNLKYYRLLQRLEFPVPRSLIRNLLLKQPKLKSKSIREINLFDYIPWDRKEIKETIISELDWRRPANSTSTWRTDCKLEVLVTYCFQNLFGCSKACFGYHRMIAENQMTREEAIKLEEKATPIFTNEIKELLKNDVGLSKIDIDRIRSFSQKPRAPMAS